MNMSSDERASLLDKAGGCALCTDYSGVHKRDKCDATVRANLLIIVRFKTMVKFVVRNAIIYFVGLMSSM